MRRTLSILAGLGFALLAAGCDTTDMRYFRYGVGTELYTSDIADTTQFQDLYLAELCRQSLPVLSPAAAAECTNAALTPADWALIVQAGMNDIDRRCDGYLAWLDDRRRTNSSILKQLGDTTVTTQGIMRLAGVGADPITIAGLAFGLASNTFTNINSRLLLEVDKTTVQTLVLRRRSDFRLDAGLKRVNSRPAAIHALRLYLTICTPFAIETDINSTVTVYQSGGLGALGSSPPLISPATIAPLSSSTFVDTPPVRGSGANQPPPPVDPTHKTYFVTYDPKVHTPRFVRNIANKLCLKDSDADVAPRMKAAIQVFQQVRVERQELSATVTGVLTPEEVRILADVRAYMFGGAAKCDRNKFRNIYEASTLWPGGVSSLSTIPLLNRALAAEQRMCPTVPEKTVRARIADIRLALVAKLKLNSIELVEQLTPDLVGLLFDMPTVADVACTGAAPPADNPGGSGRTTTKVVPR